MKDFYKIKATFDSFVINSEAYDNIEAWFYKTSHNTYRNFDNRDEFVKDDYVTESVNTYTDNMVIYDVLNVESFQESEIPEMLKVFEYLNAKDIQIKKIVFPVSSINELYFTRPNGFRGCEVKGLNKYLSEINAPIHLPFIAYMSINYATPGIKKWTVTELMQENKRLRTLLEDRR